MDGSEGDTGKATRLARRQALGDALLQAFSDVGQEEAPERLRRLAEELDEKLRSKDRKAERRNASDG